MPEVGFKTTDTVLKWSIPTPRLFGRCHQQQTILRTVYSFTSSVSLYLLSADHIQSMKSSLAKFLWKKD